LDILAQQIVAACSCQDWDEKKLLALFRGAYPYQDLGWTEYEDVLRMLSEGISTRRGRSRVHIHRDRVNGKLRARKGARLSALTGGGAIPDTFSYAVIAEPEEKVVGTLDGLCGGEHGGGRLPAGFHRLAHPTRGRGNRPRRGRQRPGAYGAVLAR